MFGLIGKKLGMTQVFDEDGVLTPVTVIHIEPNVVVGNRESEKCGYDAVVLGAGECKAKNVTKPVAGQFKDSSFGSKRYIQEVRGFEKECKVGDTLGVEQFTDTGFVDVVGTSKGKGFQGVMKRHGFHGGPGGHGSKFHRAPGSTGMAAWPSRVHKGTKMPGRMGGERNTVQNLQVVKVDSEKNVVMVKGAIPGTRNSVVFVRNAKKK